MDWLNSMINCEVVLAMEHPHNLRLNVQLLEVSSLGVTCVHAKRTTFFPWRRIRSITEPAERISVAEFVGDRAKQETDRTLEASARVWGSG